MGNTTAATGQSIVKDPAQAVNEAIAAAQARLHRPAKYGFLFASPRLPMPRALAAARAASPQTEFIACSTSGEFTECGPTHGGVSVMLVAGDDVLVDTAFSEHMGANPEGTAKALCAGFARAEAEGRQRGLAHSTTLLLIDGLSPVVERVTNALRKHTRTFQQIAGGGAGDDMQLKECHVGRGHEVANDAAVVMNLFTKRPIGVGVAHGLEPTTKPMVATKVLSGNIVQEIDGKNAYAFYQDYARERGVTLNENNRGAFLVENEIGVYFFEDLTKARAPLAVTPEGWLVCGGSVPDRANICIVAGKPEKMLDAARAAAREACDALAGAQAAAVLVFDCVCRAHILGKGFRNEIEAVQSVFPGVPIAGIMSYGEIARFKGRFDGLHNNTIVVVAIPA